MADDQMRLAIGSDAEMARREFRVRATQPYLQHAYPHTVTLGDVIEPRTSQVVGLDATGFALVDRWLDHRRTIGITARAPIFCTLKGGKLSPVYVRNLFHRLGDKAGITKRVHPHGLRHSLASELVRDGVPLNLIQRQLCHSNLATTSRYVESLHPGELIKAIQAREWAFDA